MAGSKSAYMEAQVLDLILGDGAFSQPATVYIALSTAVFSAAATGTACDEVVGASYGRQSMTNNATNWPAATGSDPATKSNGTAIDFGTAGENWGTVYSVYIIDANTDGNILYGADLAAPVAVNTGSGFVIPVGQFVVTEK